METQQRSSPAVWVVALGFVGAAIVAWGFFNPTLDISSAGYALGVAIGTAALAAPLFTLVFGRFWRGRGWIAFAVILAAMVASILVTSERNRSSTKQMVSFFRDDVLGAVSNSDPLAPMSDISPAARQSGDLGALQDFVVEMYNQQAATQRAYLAALDDLKWDSVLDLARIERDISFAETRRLFAEGRAIIKRHRDGDVAYLDGLEGRAKTVRVSSPDVLDELLRGLKRGVEENRPILMEMWRLESEVVDRIEVVAEFLHARRGSWALDGEQLLLETDADVEEYNGRYAAVEATIAKQDQLRAAQLAAADTKLRAVEDRLDRE